MHDSYTEDETKQIEKEIEYFRLTWMHMMDDYNNGEIYSIHHAPAVYTTCMGLFTALVDQQIKDGQISHDMIAAYGATMLVFGQKLAMEGKLVANMVQCNCTQFSDNELEEFVGKSKEG